MSVVQASLDAFNASGVTEELFMDGADYKMIYDPTGESPRAYGIDVASGSADAISDVKAFTIPYIAEVVKVADLKITQEENGSF